MKEALLLLNLGSPDKPTAKALKPYLRQFLMDKRVLDIPWLIRALLVNLIIVPFRSTKSAHAYKNIWTDKGSPLVEHTRQLAQALEKKLDVAVYWGMRYGQPSTQGVIERMSKDKVKKVICVPLYPHYAMSSYETALEEAKKWVKASGMQIESLPVVYSQPKYIDALAKRIKENRRLGTHLLFSYHGIPVRHLIKTGPSDSLCQKTPDCCERAHSGHETCYLHQVKKTTALVAQKLKLKETEYSMAFQSRLQGEWLSPFTDKVLIEMAKEGIKNVDVVCPSFVSDCLETIEEIGIREKESFEEHGGESLQLIPCLNESPDWVDFLAKEIKEKIQ